MSRIDLMGAPEPDVFFLPQAGGQRLCIYHAPRRSGALQGRARAAIVYLHPLAEEMNKCRRMVAIQARRLAASGFAVLQIDLKGCGDSSGDFQDATWEDWLADSTAASAWLLDRHPVRLVWWGVRLGALLAVEAAVRRATGDDLLLWQPVVSGEAAVRQLIRLKLAAGLEGGSGKLAMQKAMSDLFAGQAVDVGGYRLSAELARGLQLASMTGLMQAPGIGASTSGKFGDDPRSVRPRLVGEVNWIEVASSAEQDLGQSSLEAIGALVGAGAEVISKCVVGPPFWGSVEPQAVPVLLDTTDSALAAFGK